MSVPALRDTLLWIILTSLSLLIGCDSASTDSVKRVGDVAGTVRDTEGGGLLGGVQVTCGNVSDTTGQDGKFFLDGLSAGFSILEARKDGYERYVEGIEVEFHTDHDIFMDKAIYIGSLRGFVYLRGSTIPVSDVIVICGSRSTVSGPDGYYFIDSLKEGRKDLTAIKNNYVVFETQVDPAATSELIIPMASATLTGEVTSRVDGPIEGAVVTVTGLSATSDANGRFEIPIAPQGSHKVTVTHDVYGPISSVLQIDGTPDDLSFVLMRDVYDTLYVSNDANIVFTGFGTCNDCPEWWPYYQGDDYDSRLRLEYYMRQDPGGSLYFGYTRFLLQLPQRPEYLGPYDIDSAWLYVSGTGESFRPGAVTVRRAIGSGADWSETLVNWISAPSVSNLALSTAEFLPTQSWEIDVRGVYRDPLDHLRTLRFQKEETGLAADKEYLYFWSSEAPSIDLRPFVVIKYYY